MPERPMRQQMEEFILSLQDEMVKAFESLDANAPAFKRDSWVRPQGGLGKSCVFSVPFDHEATSPSRTILEKAGVNTSIVHDILPPAAIKQMRADHSSMPLPDSPEGLPFFAAGISLVIHPRNPYAPTVHANYRYFEITERIPKDVPKDADHKPKILSWWFGGGSRSHTVVSLRFISTLHSKMPVISTGQSCTPRSRNCVMNTFISRIEESREGLEGYFLTI
ncbi:hypothetical protein M378DRAFT_159805 [Amanita muscaria Koide BX008]|uniref:coproporphyrinogen oxidase n=1 Tax=Amanita muscaria (strain Koide BX008) TaxID=946122 RepID=A0A0C2XEX1_AMAMK|nr:hypothetical protein M378DRAFT_159805 [Amanita muscaria Koide BX008]